MFSAIPTTVVHGTVSLDTRTHRPIASPPGHRVFAIAWLTTIARGAPATSCTVMPRPRRILVPMVAK